MKTPSRYITASGLAQLLCVKTSTIYTQRTRNPSALPPATRLPGSAKLRWRRDVVERWLQQFDPDPAQIPGPTRRRGRPRKIAPSGQRGWS